MAISQSNHKPALERLLDKISPEPNTGCWLWLGAVDISGYGIMRDDHKRTQKAHRVSYELHVGPIPTGMQIDHLCRVRSCVNPRHLEVVTLQENLRRGLGNGPAIVALKLRAAKITHCPQGHPYSPENTRIYRGMRGCIECNRTQARERARRLSAEHKLKARILTHNSSPISIHE